jgi:hypothetical protein
LAILAQPVVPGHKKQDTFLRGAYLFKADYGLDRVGYHDPKYPVRHFCLRGKDRDARAKGKNQHPSFTWLANDAGAERRQADDGESHRPHAQLGEGPPAADAEGQSELGAGTSIGANSPPGVPAA